MSINLSYAHGTSDVPLKGETIGQHLRGMASVFPQRGGPGLSVSKLQSHIQ